MITYTLVIPAFNREREVGRALASCLAQDYPHWEAVVVDDGSTDGTWAEASGTGDGRVRVLRHEVNRGHGPARRTAVEAARGDWIVLLDSDDALQAGALTAMAAQVERHGDEVGRICFASMRDDGETSPSPLIADQTLDYPEYLAWLEGRDYWDFLACVKRSTFDEVIWPEQRWVDTSRYNLDFAARFRTRMCAAVWGKVHLDAEARLTYWRRRSRVARSVALEIGADLDRLLADHGAAMRVHAPGLFAMYNRMRASYHFLAGERWGGVRRAAAAMRTEPFTVDAWGLPLVGVVSPAWFAELRASRRIG